MLLNKTRGRDTKVLLGLGLLATVLTSPVLVSGTGGYLLVKTVGSLLIALCAMGRVYCTAFLGGYKNQRLITGGPFSVCRNPLYVCSFVGVCGIALVSCHLVIMVLLPLGLWRVYEALVIREEQFLRQTFGQDYADYCAVTPRFVPALVRFRLPETVAADPRLLMLAVRDGMAWFFVLPVFDFIDYLHRAGLLTSLFRLP